MTGKPQFLIAAPSSNAGKTTVTLALLRLLADRGLRIQPFKCGPDYLDPTHHTQAARRPSINLDLFMMSAGHVQELYSRHVAHADVAIAEGMMGLFDGSEKMEGSSGAIAAVLGLPVVLVVDGSAMAYSAAALVAGYARFRSDVRVVGVIFNFVNSERHYEILREACADIGVEALGYVPRSDTVRLPSRHLGLAISPENDYEAVITRAAAHIAKTVAIERLLALTTRPSPERVKPPQVRDTSVRRRIAVARDEAFNFTYHENLNALERLGKIVYFSPLHDTAVPEADLVYLAGGYPELFLEPLAANSMLRSSLQAHAAAGRAVFAECGGMMYLGRHIVDAAGRQHAMAGLLPLETSMQQARLTLGYRRVQIAGREWRGHEFHFSTLVELEPLGSAARVSDARDREVATKVYRRSNIVASYVHFYWGEHTDLAELLTPRCR